MNNWAVVYTSVTGNTEKLAKAMAEELGCDCFTTDNAPEDLSKYDVIVAGYWLRLGGPADKMKAFLQLFCHYLKNSLRFWMMVSTFSI